jgi:hypothetical protein
MNEVGDLFPKLLSRNAPFVPDYLDPGNGKLEHG